MKDYKLHFDMPYISPDNFKQKHYNILTATIAGSRLREYMSLEGSAHISFNSSDIQQTSPIVTVLDKFSKMKSNCIVYNLSENMSNQNYYDKLFIYQTIGNKHSYYGYILYNSKLNKCTHIYFLEYDDNNLLSSLNKNFSTMYRREIYEHYSKKNDAIKHKNGLGLNDIQTIKDYNDMKTSYITRKEKYMRVA